MSFLWGIPGIFLATIAFLNVWDPREKAVGAILLGMAGVMLIAVGTGYAIMARGYSWRFGLVVLLGWLCFLLPGSPAGLLGFLGLFLPIFLPDRAAQKIAHLNEVVRQIAFLEPD